MCCSGSLMCSCIRKFHLKKDVVCLCQIEHDWLGRVSDIVQVFSGSEKCSVGKQCEDYA